MELTVTRIVDSAPGMENRLVIAHAKVEYTAPADVDRLGSSRNRAGAGIGFECWHLGPRQGRRS
jgi:hypothetical protein